MQQPLPNSVAVPARGHRRACQRLPPKGRRTVIHGAVGQQLFEIILVEAGGAGDKAALQSKGRGAQAAARPVAPAGYACGGGKHACCSSTRGATPGAAARGGWGRRAELQYTLTPAPLLAFTHQRLVVCGEPEEAAARGQSASTRFGCTGNTTAQRHPPSHAARLPAALTRSTHPRAGQSAACPPPRRWYPR